MHINYKLQEIYIIYESYIYINNSFVSFRLSLYSYDLLDLCNVLFLMNFDLIMLFISLILPYGRCISCSQYNIGLARLQPASKIKMEPFQISVAVLYKYSYMLYINISDTRYTTSCSESPSSNDGRLHQQLFQETNLRVKLLADA